jgi:hypothetical protein
MLICGRGGGKPLWLKPSTVDTGVGSSACLEPPSSSPVERQACQAESLTASCLMGARNTLEAPAARLLCVSFTPMLVVVPAERVAFKEFFTVRYGFQRCVIFFDFMTSRKTY